MNQIFDVYSVSACEAAKLIKVTLYHGFRITVSTILLLASTALVWFLINLPEIVV